MQPLRVTARLATPVVYFGDGMHLDGVLAWGMFCALDRDTRDALPPISSPWAIDFDLPLARWRVAMQLPSHTDPRIFAEPPRITASGHLEGEVWGWCASAVHAVWLGEDTHMVRKRSPIEALARFSPEIRKVLVASGQYKSWQKPYPARWSNDLTWYAMGDLEEVRRVLAHVDGLGKLVKHGMGKVLAWEVEAHPTDHSVFDGTLRRTMPQAFGHGIPTPAKIRPPYHHTSRLVPAVLPCYEELVPLPC